MAQQDLKYIRNNYFTIEELAQKTAIPTSSILNLIKENIIPSASYTIVENIEISSPLGDTVMHKTSTDYYAKSTVQLLLNQAASADKGNAKSYFKAQFRDHLLNHPDRDFAYGNIFNEAGELKETEFEKAFEVELESYMAGIYGICTLNATEEEIVRKEIAVKKLIDFNNRYGAQPLSDEQKQNL